jgi:hypothetical protein
MSRAGSGHYILMNCIDEKLRLDVGVEDVVSESRGPERAMLLLIASLLEISGGKLNESLPLFC